MNSPTGQTRRRIFTFDGSNDADSRKDVPSGVVVDIAPHFGGEISPKPHFGGVNRRFQAKRTKYWKFHVIETTATILTKSGTTIAYRPSSSYRGWSQQAPNKSKMADGRHFEKTVKSPYLCNRLTDFDEIWHGDAYWTPAANQPLKFRIFENPRWQRPPSWKITKSRYLRNVWPIFTKCGMLMENDPLNPSDR